MKILQINCVYNIGSTGKITADIHNALINKGHESFVICSRDKNSDDKNIISLCSSGQAKINHVIANITGIRYGGCAAQTAKVIKTIKNIDPDVVHIQCINGYFVNIYQLVDFLKRSHIYTVISLHAEFMYTANCSLSFGCDEWKNGCRKCQHKRMATGSYIFNRTKKSHELFKKAYSGFDKELVVVGCSNWIAERAAQSPLMSGFDMRTIYNGIDTTVFCPTENDIRKKLSIGEEEKTILWITSSFSNAKGKDYFFELAEKMKGGSYRFVVVGADRPDGYDGDVMFLGRTNSKKELAAFYTVADTVISCSRQETYPTIFLEAQCCGTPVVGFDVGGVAESVYPGMGQTVKLGDVDGMCKAIGYWANKKKEISKDTVNGCLRVFSSNNMCENYIGLYKDILANKSC